MLTKGVAIVPTTARVTGPWLDATRATPLQRVANRPILCHVLEAMRDAGVTEVALVTPPDVADEIAVCLISEAPGGIEAHQIIVGESRGELIDALTAAADFIGDQACLLHRADGLLGQPLAPLLELMSEEETDVLLPVHRRGGDTKRLRLVGKRPSGISESERSKTLLGATGVCLLGPGAMRRSIDSDWQTNGLDFASLAEALARGGASVQTQAVGGWRHFTGDALELLDMNRTMLDSLKPEQIESEDDDNRFEGCVVIHPSATVVSSVIVGPAIIGAEALVSHSYIGPHTSIGERVRVEGAEIERSIVLAGASIMHVGGRLVASVVGRDARIFRDFSMPRALRLQVGDGDEVALC